MESPKEGKRSESSTSNSNMMMVNQACTPFSGSSPIRLFAKSNSFEQCSEGSFRSTREICSVSELGTNFFTCASVAEENGKGAGTLSNFSLGEDVRKMVSNVRFLYPLILIEQ